MGIREYSVSNFVSYQSLLSNLAPLAPAPKLSISAQRKRMRLILVRFFKLEDFMIYRLVMKRLKYHHQQPPIARFCSQCNHAFEMLIFVPRFKSISFNQNKPKKITLFCKKKIAKSQNAWGSVLNPLAFGGYGRCLPPPNLRRLGAIRA